MTEMPPPERFSRERGHPETYRWYAHTEGGAGFDVCVPGDDEEPYAASVEMAAALVGDVPVLAEEAVVYIHAAVDASRRGIFGAPSVVSACFDARDDTVTLDLNWESDLYSLWHVTFKYAHDRTRRHPNAFGRRDWVATGG